MSTSYYYLREPISSLRVETAGEHTRITIWERGANIGTLTTREPHLWLSMLGDADDLHCPMRTHWGGVEVGCVVTENAHGLDPALQLVSENCELVTVADVRAKAGGGKKTPEPASRARS